MKKVFLLTTALILLISTIVLSQNLSEGFEGTTFPPDGWAKYRGTNGLGTIYDWQRSTTGYRTGVACAYVRYENVTGGLAEDWLVTPLLSVTPSNNTLSFWMKDGFPSNYGSTLYIKVSTTSQTSQASFTNLTNYSEPGTTYVQKNVDLSAYNGQDVYIAFVWVQDDGDNLFVDDISGPALFVPACAPPTALTIANIQPTTATISWTAPASAPANGYQWEVRTSGEGGSGATGLAASGSTAAGVTTANVTGLTSATNYNLYVRSNCGGSTFSSWAGPSSFVTSCETVSTFTQNFDAVTTPNLPTCWAKVGTGGSASTQSSSSNSAPNCLYLYSSGTSYGIVSVPQLTNLGDNTHRLKFYARANFSPGAKVEVGYLTNPTDGSTFVLLNSFVLGTTYAEYTVDPGILVNAINGVLAFRCDGVVAYSLLIDDVRWEQKPLCPEPSALTVTNITSTSASLGWTPAGSESSWNIEWGLSGFTQGTGTVISGVSTNPYNLTGLSSNQTYSFYVQAACGANGVSAWVGPYSFTTKQIPATLPFSETFEVWPNSWTVVNGTQTNKWMVGSATSYAGSKAAYISNDNGATNAYTITSASVSHLFRDIQFPANGIEFILSFYWKGLGETTLYDYLRVSLVETSVDPVAGTTLVTTSQIGIDYYNVSTYQIANITLPGTLAGQTRRLVFTWKNDGSIGTQPPSAIDNISIIPLTCPAPTALAVTNVMPTTASLSWTAPSVLPGAGYQWEIRSGTTTVVASGSTPAGTTTANVTGLTPSTAYNLYVRSSCGGGDFSTWSGPKAFTTLAPPVTVFPFMEGFEGTTFPPSGWSLVDNDADNNNWFSYSIAGVARNGTKCAASASWSNVALTPDNWLVSPQLVIPAAGTYYLEYFIGAQDPAWPAEKYGVFISQTNTAPASFTEVFSETLSAGGWNQRVINLSPYAGKSIFIAFRHYDCTDQFYIKLDDVYVGTTAGPVSITANAISPTQINLSAVPNPAGNNILVAWNTTNVFGTPSGPYNAGSSISGGGTVHYVGSAAGLYPHSNVSEGTTYYYRAWSLVAGPSYSGNYAASQATTFYGVPYFQDFNESTSFPGGWAGTFAVTAAHGTGGSNGLTTNLWSSNTTANFTTPTIVLPSASPCRLVFDYRIVNYSGYPGTATSLGPNDKIEIKYSTDNGLTYTTLHTINQANHTSSVNFSNKRVSLSTFSGPIKFQFVGTWGVGDYYVDIDNFKVEVTPTEPIFTVTPASKEFGSVSIFGISPAQTFTFSNTGIGTLDISGVALSGQNPGEFVLTDGNSYPLSLAEGQSATLQVAFDPTSGGAKTANIVFTRAGDGKTVYNVPLSGMGVDPTIVSFPFRESFEPTSSSRPGWLTYNIDGGGTNWAFTTTYNHTSGGTTSIYHQFSSAAYQVGWLVSPPIQLPANSAFALSFWSYNLYPLDYEKNSVLISTGSMNPLDDDFVEIWTTDEISTSWVETANLSLESFAGQQIFIAFKYEGNNAHNWYVDDVLINTPLDLTYASTPLSCFGSNDGTITLNIVGGAAPYTILVTGPDNFSSNQPVMTNLAAGDYVFVVTDAEATSISGLITLTQPDPLPTPTVQNLTVTYDGMLHTINAVAPAGTSLVWYDAATGGEVTEAPSETNAGVYNAWVAAFDEIAGCESARVAVVLTINKKGLTVTADNKTKCQFTPNPELTFAYAGFVAGEGPENLETMPTVTTTALPNSAPGTYPITLGGGVSSNYAFTYVNAILTIIKSPIVNAGPDGAVCSGESFQFVAASASNYTTILWSTSGNGTFSSTSAVNPVYTPGSIDIANGSVTLTLTGDPGSSCSQQSSMVLTIQNDLQVSVEVIQVTEDVCVGTLVHFMALPTNGGLTPAYQWKVNGTNAGTNSADFAYVPANNDVVTVVLTSSIGCALNNPATSAPLTVHVTSDLTAGVSIFANATSVCDFTSVTFTAVPDNGGSNPSYQWFVNNVASGANASTFSYIPLDGDEVHVVMTSNHACAVVPVATSNTVEMNVAPPFLELFANPVNGGTVTGSGNYPAGTSVTVVATPSPGWEFLNWKNADGTIISTNASYVHTINYCYEALTATFSSTAKIAGQLKYFNNQETIIPSPNNYGVFYVQLFEGQTAIGERQLLRYNVENGMDSYFEYIGVESGKDYKLRIWEQATNNQLGNVWTWNNWGGSTANDALIIGFMTANNPILTQLPWIAPVAVPNYTPLFSKVADMNNSNSLTGVDALLLQYVMTGAPGYMPLPGGAHNFRFATTRLPNHGAMTYPNAPELLFTPFGNYQATTTASDVYHEVSLNNLSDGLNVFNVYLVASGDVNASFKPGLGAKAGADILYEGELAASEGEVVIIPVKVNQTLDFAAMSIGFSFNNNLIEVLSVENYPIHYIDNEASTVRVAWVDQQGKSLNNGDDLMLIKARIVGNLQSGDRYFELMPDVEFADINANVIGGVGLTLPYIESGVTGLNDSQQSLAHSAYPNPFRGQTRINYLLPEAGKVKISLYNNFGQEIKILVDENLEAGSHQLLVNSSDLKDAGQYFYRISLDGHSRIWTVKGTLIYVK